MIQRDIVLRHMKDYGSISSWVAIKEYGITRLSAVIWSLKHEGYVIASSTVYHTNRYGRRVSYSVYSLVKDDNGEPIRRRISSVS